MGKNLIINSLLAIFISCVEPYEFEVLNTERVLVVDGSLTNEIKAHQIRLSFSGALDVDSVQYAQGATVWIMEDQEVRIDLSEKASGVYVTQSDFQGKVGSSYTLYIRLKDGKEYQSTTVNLPSPITIDRIYGRYLEIPSDEDDQILRGIQILLDTENASSESSNYRFEYEEDYEIRVPYPSVFEWDNLTETYSPRALDISTCYGYQKSNGIHIGTTSGQSQNSLVEYPLRMVLQEEPQLYSKYSIRVKQFSISSSTYQFYKKLKENNEASGSFFDKQKGTIVGNVERVGQSEQVLGYFEVAGVSERTAFFTPDKFEDQGFMAINPFNSFCTYTEVADSISTSYLNNGSMSGRNIFNFTFPIPDTAILVTETCSDCREHGKIEKPDFWD